MVRCSVLAASVGISLLTATLPVSADPITVTGTINIIREPESGQANLSGPGFAFDSKIAWLEGNVGPFACDAPCPPGKTFDAGGQMQTTFWSGGTLTLNGVIYPVTSGIDSVATLSMQIFGTVQSPPAGEATSVTVPVTMESLVLIDSQTRAMLRGTGNATIFFTPTMVPEFEWRTTRVQYDFTDAAAVPEPATLLLVGAGLAAAGALKRRNATGAAIHHTTQPSGEGDDDVQS